MLKSEVSPLLIAIKEKNVAVFKKFLGSNMRSLTLRDDLCGPIKAAPSTWKYNFKLQTEEVVQAEFNMMALALIADSDNSTAVQC